MRKLAFLAVLVVFAGGWYLLKDAGHVPMYSANLERLAETSTEGYCAGKAFWSGGASEQDRKIAASECRTARGPSDYNLAEVQPAFCEAVTKEGYAPGVDVCLDIVVKSQLWPTYNGGLTRAWSRNFPYPGRLILQQTTTDDSRTGNREGNIRND